MGEAPLLLDSVTQLTPAARGRVACCGSHGGTYAAWYAARQGIAALVLHDAGIGRERAGVAGLAWLDGIGVPAAAVAHDSARIGEGAEMAARGVLSVVNRAAAALGLAPGMACGEALARLAAAPLPPAEAAGAPAEARVDLGTIAGRRILALDSNGLVGPEDAGAVVVTGSHGGLLGGRAESAVKAAVRAAVYNDAGGGAGTSRLPALDARGIAAATVSCFSARIGEALSTWRDGFVSALNDTARRQGGAIGQPCRDFVTTLLLESDHP